MKRDYFNYDGLVCISDSLNDTLKIKNYISTYKNKNFLGCIFNHRLFSLKSKNTIKNKIDYLDLDYIMFSLRPSLIRELKRQLNRKEVNRFKIFSTYYFFLLSSFKYGFKNSIFFSSENIETKEVFKWLNKYILQNKKLSNKQKILFNIIKYSDFKKIEKNIEINLLKTNNFFKKFKNQIPQEHKDLFFVGFDKNFTEVDWKKKYKPDYWTRYKKKTNFGEPLFDKIKYCKRCCLPETSEGMDFDKFGICTLCRNSEQKMVINWRKRQNTLETIFKRFRKKKYYDALLPISGGKDSTFQAHILKQNNVYPLAVTHGQNWLSLTGRYNLENLLIKFDLDHVVFNASRKKINRVAKQSITEIGDSCWHCHIGAGTFAVQSALFWKLNLIIYGEGPGDTDARGSHKKIIDPDPLMFLKGSAIKKAEIFENKYDNSNYLSNWKYPSLKDLKKLKLISLGNYIFWDEHKNIDFVINNYGWLNTKVENTYKGYKSTECIMAGVHDYLNFLKRGIGRATLHASEDVRRGLITRREGFELAKKYDIQKPHALNYYKKITNLSEKKIIKIIKQSALKSSYAKKLKI